MRRTRIDNIRGRVIKVLPDGSIAVSGTRQTFVVTTTGIRRRDGRGSFHWVTLPRHSVSVARGCQSSGADVDVRVTVTGRLRRRRHIAITHARNAAPMALV